MPAIPPIATPKVKAKAFSLSALRTLFFAARAPREGSAGSRILPWARTMKEREIESRRRLGRGSELASDFLLFRFLQTVLTGTSKFRKPLRLQREKEEENY